jgi:hypothetical protein
MKNVVQSVSNEESCIGTHEIVETANSGSSASHEINTSPSQGDAAAVPTQEQRPRTRLQNNIKRPKWFSDYVCLLSCAREPNSWHEAIENADWRGAMDIEYGALIKNNI